MSMSGKPRLEANATADDADVLAVLRDIVDEIKGLRSDLAAVERRRSAPRPLSHADANALATLFPAIDAALPGEVFSVRLLHDYSKLNARRYIALREGLAAIGNPRQIG